MAEQRELEGVQYLRGICAIAVVCTHVASMVENPKYFGQQIFSGFLHLGAQGVDIFFVVSGFIITIVTTKDYQLPSSVSRFEFLRKRFTRIVPLMWLAIFTHAAMRLRGDILTPAAFPYLRSFFLIPVGYTEPTIIWTLRNEFVFYLVFAVTWIGSPRFRPLLSIWLLSPILIAMFRGGIGVEFDRTDPVTIIFSSANLEFGAGVLVGLIWLKRRATISMPLLHPYLALIALTLGALAVNAFSPFPWLSLGNTAQFAIMGGLLVHLAARMTTPSDNLSKVGVTLGNASFSIYLFHFHMASPILLLWSHFAKQTSVYVVIFVTIVGAVLAGIIIHLFVERPLIAVSRNLLVRRPLSRNAS